MTLDLTEEETAALTRLLTNTIDADRYPLSPRIQLLKGILAKIRPEPAREPLPEPKLGRERPDSAVSPPKHYESPRSGRYRRRG